MTSSMWRGLGSLAVLMPTLLVCMTGVAAAHVTVQPDTATSGSETTFTFRVPAEKAHARTVRILLALPATPPIPVVSLQPVPGWAAGVTTRKLPRPVQTDDGPVSRAVSRVTWTSHGSAHAIAPGQFQEFTIEAGPLPTTRRLVFKVLQYYSDGSVVRWIDPPTSGGQPEHPAPTVTLGDAPGSAAGGDETGTATATGSGDGWIAVGGFVAGLLGFAAGTAALVVARRSGRKDPA